MSKGFVRPNFYVAGTAKSGTSSLAEYFRQHPDVCFCQVEEPNYFAKEEDWALGPDYYAGLYSHYDGEAAIGEKSWRYSCFETYPEAWRRMKAWSGDFKAIYIAREPFARVCSMWREMRDAAQDDISRDPGYAITHDTLLVESSLYHRQASMMIDDLGRENVLLLLYEDFVADPQQFYDDICDFLAIERFRVPGTIHRNPSVGQRQDRPLTEIARGLGLVDLARKALPGAVLAGARNALKVPLGKVEVPPADRARFFAMIEEDKRQFLALAGKPANFWDKEAA